VVDLSRRLQRHAEEKEQAAKNAARRAARIAWHVEALHDGDWDLQSMNAEMGTRFYKGQYQDAYDALEEYVSEGKMEMTSKQYAKWRQDWEHCRREELGDKYAFERTDTDDEFDYGYDLVENDDDDVDF
jgi:translation initiation factor 2 alpha subunit (eIF-2alpha)